MADTSWWWQQECIVCLLYVWFFFLFLHDIILQAVKLDVVCAKKEKEKKIASVLGYDNWEASFLCKWCVAFRGWLFIYVQNMFLSFKRMHVQQCIKFGLWISGWTKPDLPNCLLQPWINSTVQESTNHNTVHALKVIYHDWALKTNFRRVRSSSLLAPKWYWRPEHTSGWIQSSRGNS